MLPLHFLSKSVTQKIKLFYAVNRIFGCVVSMDTENCSIFQLVYFLKLEMKCFSWRPEWLRGLVQGCMSGFRGFVQEHF